VVGYVSATATTLFLQVQQHIAEQQAQLEECDAVLQQCELVDGELRNGNLQAALTAVELLERQSACAASRPSALREFLKTHLPECRLSIQRGVAEELHGWLVAARTAAQSFGHNAISQTANIRQRDEESNRDHFAALRQLAADGGNSLEKLLATSSMRAAAAAAVTNVQGATGDGVEAGGVAAAAAAAAKGASASPGRSTVWSSPMPCLDLHALHRCFHTATQLGKREWFREYYLQVCETLFACCVIIEELVWLGGPSVSGRRLRRCTVRPRP